MPQPRAIQEFRARVREQISDLLSDGQERRPIEIAQHFGYSVTATTQALTYLLETGQVSRSEKVDQERSGHKAPVVFYRRRSD